ncbi:MAG: hypothetical protein ACRYGG_04370 [Janthinobacterium lividum]
MHAGVSSHTSAASAPDAGTAHCPERRAYRRPLRRFAARGLGVVLFATALTCSIAGCSPRYDWRNIVNDEAGYSAMFPAKPVNDKRHIVIDGQSLLMQMQQANGGNAVFAVGVVTLPSPPAGGQDASADVSALQAKALSFMRTGLASNFSSSPDTATPLSIGGTPPLSGWAWHATGSPPGRQEPRNVSARFFATGRRVYEVAVISSERLPDEQVEQFFDSFHPL